MDARTTPGRIVAQVTIEGPAEEVLANVQRLRGGERSVFLRPWARTDARPNSGFHTHMMPVIKAGEVQAAREKLHQLARQSLVDRDMEQRLERLIEDFGRWADQGV